MDRRLRGDEKRKDVLDKTTNADLVRSAFARCVVGPVAQSKLGTSAMSGLRSVPRTSSFAI